MVNTFARLYTWKGSKPELQPILLMAHMDGQYEPCLPGASIADGASLSRPCSGLDSIPMDLRPFLGSP